MTPERFFSRISGREDDLRLAAEALAASGSPFCLIGGLAVNHYVEPVVTLDADFAVSASVGIAEALIERGFKVERHSHSVNATLPGSRLRVQITINDRYGPFPARAVPGEIFGIKLPIATLADLVQGKLWALCDEKRRASKRLKDKADLVPVCEPEVIAQIPGGLIAEVDAMRKK